jgi:tripartite-type tricarboxylate transporter receptor subunit TctC
MSRTAIFRAIAGCFLAVALAVPSAVAQDFPTRPVRLSVTFAPGGGSDLLGRATADLLGSRLGQPVVVENKPGAGGTLGVDVAVKASADGYTLLWGASDTLTVTTSVKASVPFTVPNDFAFIAQVTGFNYIIVINPKLPVKNLQELIAYAKENPGKVRYGSSGTGSASHLVPELLAKEAGIKLTHVPYGGSGPANTAAMGGHIDIVFTSPQVKNLTESGQLRAIAQTGALRDPGFPDVPTLKESGFPTLVIPITWGLLAPAGTPESVLAKLRAAAAEMMKDPATAERFRKLGYEPAYLPHDQFREFIIKDLEQWRGVAKSANITTE